MSLEEFAEILAETGLPIAFKAFPDDQKTKFPYLCYQEPETNNFFADGIVYYSFKRIAVELYCKLRSLETETTIETVFHNHGLPWVKEAYYNDKQKCYEIDYEIEV